jgi:flagellar biosynthetic protein FlhB
MLVSVGAALAQGGLYFATKSLKPKFSKLDPLKGAKRIFGPQALWEGAKMLLKSAFVGLVIYLGIR